MMYNTSPTASVFSVGDSGETNSSGDDHIALCFHTVEGYSHMGFYKANGVTNGPFLPCTFRPAFILFKNFERAQNWQILDDTRDTYNLTQHSLAPNTHLVENATSGDANGDIVSNGFKIRAVGTSDINYAVGDQGIYMAFARSPSKYANAR